MAETFFTLTDYQVAAAFLKERIGSEPLIGLILGSGLNPLAEEIENPIAIPYDEVPGFPVTTVEGHIGRIISGQMSGSPILVMQGRAHYYEGYSIQQVVFPVKVMQLMGVKVLIITNAAGGLNPSFKAGDLMLIIDHINLPGMAGINPLRGPNDEALGPRFVDMVNAYDPELRNLAHKAAKKAGLELHEGVYVMVAGPNYETPAEVRLLRLIGADAVGMSTVPEVLAARHGGMKVLGISGISNIIPLHPADKGPNHEEVLEAGKLVLPRLKALLRVLIPMIYAEER